MSETTFNEIRAKKNKISIKSFKLNMDFYKICHYISLSTFNLLWKE